MHKYLNPKNYLRAVSYRLIEKLPTLARKWQKDKTDHYGRQSLKHQPIFIIGAPRTGSTILYQTLTNLYDVLYVDNLVCRFHKNFFLGFWLSNKIFGSKPHNNFNSNHGSTQGWHSPSECGQFWYRWLPLDHHFIDFHEITPGMVEQIRTEISAVINYFNKPLVFKNLNAGQRIRLLTRCFPKAKFLFITREPIYTAQSIIKSKRTLGIKDNAFWSIMPPNIRDLQNLSCDEQVVKQIFYLEKQIIKDRRLTKDGAFFTIHYKRLSLKYMEALAKNIGLAQKSNAKSPVIRIKEQSAASKVIFEKLSRQIEELDWTFLPADDLNGNGL